MNKRKIYRVKESDLIDSHFVNDIDSDSMLTTDILLEPDKNDIGTLVGDSESRITDPALQYDPREDPEYINESKSLWKGYVKNSKRLVENIATDLPGYLIADCNRDPDMFNFQDFLEKFPMYAKKWADDEIGFRNGPLAKSIAKLKKKGGLGKDTSSKNDSKEDEPKPSTGKRRGRPPKNKDREEVGYQIMEPENPEESKNKKIDYSKLSSFAQDIIAETEELDAKGALQEVMSLESKVNFKYKSVYYAAANILSGRSLKKFVTICGDAGVGKSYSVNQAIKNIWDGNKSALKAKGWKLTRVKGSVGSAATNIIIFFFSHRNNEVIVLDDADGFLLNKDQDVQNLLKALFEMDNTPAHPQNLTIPPIMANKATSFLKNMASKKESIQFSIDAGRLRENILSVSINGNRVMESYISDEEAALFQSESLRESIQDYKPVRETFVPFRESNDDEDEFIDDDNEEDQDLPIEVEETVVPTQWNFSSRIILISNLNKNQLNDAVATRCDVVELHLEPDEFSCRLKQVLPNMMKDLSATTFDKELVEYARDTAYGLFNAVLECAEVGVAPFGVKVRINQKSLQFRIIPEITGGWIKTADIWVDEWNESHPEDQIEPIPANYSRIAKNIERQFVVGVLLPILSAGLPNTTKVTRKSYIETI